MRFFTATVLLGISKAALPSGQGTALVRLQSTTPGSSQSGHVNVSGTGLFGTLSATANLTTSLSGVVSGSNTSVTGGGAGVAGATASAFGYGVYGAATNATSGTAGYFRALGTNGIALSGDAPATTGANYGGYFTSSGSSGYGVYGRNFSTTGPTFGVAGQSFSPSGIGVYGSNSGGGWSGYFVGNTYVGGSLGLGTTAPSAKLDIVGTAKMSGFQLTTSPAAGAVLTSNASGIGTWQALPPSSWTVSGSNIFSANAGNVGVGTAAPDSKVHALTASGNGVHGVTSSPSDSGVWGQNTGSGYGVSGVTNSASATGVWGHNNGSGKGVWGSAGTGYGVYGTATGLQGRGVYGYSDNAAGSGIGRGGNLGFG